MLHALHTYCEVTTAVPEIHNSCVLGDGFTSGHAWLTATPTSLYPKARSLHSQLVCWPVPRPHPASVACVWRGPGNELSLNCCSATRTQPTRVTGMSRLREGDIGVRQHMGY